MARVVKRNQVEAGGVMAFQVEIERQPHIGGGAYDIYVFRNTPEGDTVAAPIEFEFITVDESQRIAAPTMRLFSRDATAFLEAFSRALQREGFETENQSFTKGKLDATERHLEDLREMLDLPKGGNP